MQFLSKDLYVTDNVRKLLVTFKTVYEGNINLSEKKVESVHYFSLEKIKQMIETEKFHPELLFLLKKHF